MIVSSVDLDRHSNDDGVGAQGGRWVLHGPISCTMLKLNFLLPTQDLN